MSTKCSAVPQDIGQRAFLLVPQGRYFLQGERQGSLADGFTGEAEIGRLAGAEAIVIGFTNGRGTTIGMRLPGHQIKSLPRALASFLNRKSSVRSGQVVR